MALVDLKSMLDRNVLGEPGSNYVGIPPQDLASANGNPVGQNPTSDGNYFTELGVSESPFDISREEKQDHLVTLAQDSKVTSINHSHVLPHGEAGWGIYDPSTYTPRGLEDQDLDTETPTQYLDNLPPGA